MSTTTPRRTSRETPNSIRNGTPAVHRNATRAIPLSTRSSPTIWKIGRRRATRTKKPTSKVATPTGTSVPAVVPTKWATPRAVAKASTIRARRSDERGRDIDQRSALTIERAGASAALPSNSGMATPLRARTTAAVAIRPASPRWTPRIRATRPRATPWAATTRITERDRAQPEHRDGADQHGAHRQGQGRGER